MSSLEPNVKQFFVQVTSAEWASAVADILQTPLDPNTLYMVFDTTALPSGGVASYGTAATCGVSLYQTNNSGTAYVVASLSQSQLVDLINAQSGGGTPIIEVPSGALNGLNTIFTLSNTPSANTLSLILNRGVLVEPDDFTIIGPTITMLGRVLVNTDSLIAHYAY